ncbi:PqqD family protein [Actinomadura fulvescens]|uniref:Coenzyme PQQ synthesis protein D n=1 Tax=Actinomadura fulvescens TaxID=46160 RepID=A0ABN3PIQ9_9ACTN
MFSDDVVIDKCPGVAYRPDGPEGRHAAVISYRGGTVRLLNPQAAEIFLACDGHRSLAEIRELLAAKYTVPLDVLHGDLLSTVSMLIEAEFCFVRGGESEYAAVDGPDGRQGRRQ